LQCDPRSNECQADRATASSAGRGRAQSQIVWKLDEGQLAGRISGRSLVLAAFSPSSSRDR